METATQKIPSGYKQTEIGMIPEDWLCLKLPEAVLSSSSSIKIGPFGSALKKEYLTKTGYKVYGQENVYEKNMSIGDRFLSTSYFRELKSCEIIAGDFLVSMMGTVGECMIVPEGIEVGIMDSHLLRIKFDLIKVDLRFIAQLFETKIIFNQIKQLSVGGIMEGLSSKIIKNIYIPLPTKKEQAMISNTLSDVDVLIKKLEKLIEKKKNIKQGVIQELLAGKRRLPGFSGKWEMKKLGEVVEFEHGRDLSKSDMSDEGVYKCIHYGQLFTEYRELVGDIKSKTNSNAGRFYSKANDVLMPTSDVTPRGLATASCIKEGGVILGGGILVIRFNAGYDGLYFSYFVSQNKTTILKLVKGSTVFHLYASDLANLEINFPKPDEQTAIANVLSDMDAEIEKLESQFTKYQNIKQGMMQTLLTGKIRLITK